MKLAIVDTADVTIKRKSDGRLFASAEAQLTSISQTLGINEKIFGGIGNKPKFIQKGQKEVTATIRNALYDQEFLALTQGVAILEDEKVVVKKREDSLQVTDDNGTLSVTIKGNPEDNTVYVVNEAGDIEETTVTSKKVDIPTGHAVEGEYVSVIYDEEVTGDVINLDADKFGEAFEIEYHTIAYDPATNEVVQDIYIQLFHVVPSGDFELSLENGTPLAPEFTFDCLTLPNTNKIGRIVAVNH